MYEGRSIKKVAKQCHSINFQNIQNQNNSSVNRLQFALLSFWYYGVSCTMLITYNIIMQVYRPQLVPSGEFRGSAFDAPRRRVKAPDAGRTDIC